MINAIGNEPYLDIWWPITANWDFVKEKAWKVPELHTVMRLSHSRPMDLLERGRRKGQWKTLLKAADLVRPDFAARPFGKRVKWVNFHPSPEKGVPRDQLARQAQRTCRVARMLSRVGQWSWEDNHDEHDEHDELDSDE